MGQTQEARSVKAFYYEQRARALLQQLEQARHCPKTIEAIIHSAQRLARSSRSAHIQQMFRHIIDRAIETT